MQSPIYIHFRWEKLKRVNL